MRETSLFLLDNIRKGDNNELVKPIFLKQHFKKKTL